MRTGFSLGLALSFVAVDGRRHADISVPSFKSFWDKEKKHIPEAIKKMEYEEQYSRIPIHNTREIEPVFYKDAIPSSPAMFSDKLLPAGFPGTMI